MILVLDVGNTHTHIGLFTVGRLRATWKLSTEPRRTVDEYCILLHGILGDETSLEGAIVCSVVPRVSPPLAEAVARACHVEPMILDHETEMGIVNAYRHPAEVGMDRLANAVGGHLLYGTPLLILDFGTAITLDFIDEPEPPQMKPIYRGGAILPGIEMAAEALARGAAKLPPVELREPRSVIGRTTAESIRSGLVVGFQGAIKTLVDQACEEIGKTVSVVSTGGDALHLREQMPYLQAVEPALTLIGLRQIYGLNNDCPLTSP